MSVTWKKIKTKARELREARAENPKVQPLVNNSQYTDAELEAFAQSLDVSSMFKGVNLTPLREATELPSLSQESMREASIQGLRNATEKWASDPSNWMTNGRGLFGTGRGTVTGVSRNSGPGVSRNSRKNKTEEGHDDLNYKLVGGAVLVALFIVGVALMKK